MIRMPIIVNTIGTRGKSAAVLQCGPVELKPSYRPGKITDWNVLIIYVDLNMIIIFYKIWYVMYSHCLYNEIIEGKSKFSKSRYSDFE